MSGDPTFTRAKRFKYLHTPHVSTFGGDETEHVKGNRTASIDGTYKMKADNASLDTDLDMMRNKILRPSNIVRTEKITVTHAQLIGTATQIVDLFRASPGDTVYNQVANVSNAFGKAATLDTGMKIEVGEVSDPNGYGVSHNATPVGWIWDGENVNEKGAYLFNATPWWRKNKTYTAGALVRATFTASAILVASYEQGEVDFYFDIMSRA